MPHCAPVPRTTSSGVRSWPGCTGASGMQELVRHDLVGGDPLVQRSVFADGTAVTCDFHAQTYEVAANGSH